MPLTFFDRKKIASFGLVAGLCIVASPCFMPAAHAQKANETEDWALISPAFKNLNPLAKTDPDAAIAGWQQIYTTRKVMAPVTGSIVFAQIANIYNSAGDKDNALSIYDEGLKLYGKDRGSVELVNGKAAILHDLGKSAEAQALFEERWPVILGAGRSHFGLLEMRGGQALQNYVRILKGKQSAPAAEQALARDKIIALLQRAFAEMPIYLDDRTQGDGNPWSPYGWMYDELITQLLAAERNDEALGWAKVRYMACKFDSEAMDRATRLLGRVWTAREEFPAIRSFARAQEATTTPAAGAPGVDNPLAEVKLPALPEETSKLLQARRQSLLELTQVASPAVSDLKELNSLCILQAAMGDRSTLGLAMKSAKKMITSDTKGEVWPGEVCRVFKAADLSPVRANTFIAYMEGTKGLQNPMPEFIKEHEKPAG